MNRPFMPAVGADLTLPEPESAEKKCHGHHPVQQFVATAGVVGKMMIGNVSIRV